MKKLFLLSLILFIGCASKIVNEQPLGYSFMPKYLELDSIHPDLPVLPDTLANKNALSYPSKFISSGKGLQGKDTVNLPAGILISEKSAVRYIFYESAYKRYETELQYSKMLCKDYYDKSLGAEKLYQQTIVDEKKKAQRSWLELNIGYIGFSLGVLTTILSEYAIIRVAK